MNSHRLGKKFRLKWNSSETESLKISVRPDSDLIGFKGEYYKPTEFEPIKETLLVKSGKDKPDGKLTKHPLKSYTELFNNILCRYLALAQRLNELFIYYKHNEILYGERFLAFVGNSVIREWPLKDFPFTSEKAQSKIDEVGKYNITGLLKSDINKDNRELLSVLKSLRYEHWTPLAFFARILKQYDSISIEDFFEILYFNYRVVWITKEENDKLNDLGLKSHRPIEGYEEAGIEVYENKMWNDIYNE